MSHDSDSFTKKTNQSTRKWLLKNQSSQAESSSVDLMEKRHSSSAILGVLMLDMRHGTDCGTKFKEAMAKSNDSKVVGP